jgi:tetratricopeptide (TPR) repeat protein
MMKIQFVIAFLIMSLGVSGQTRSSKAKEYYDNACRKIIENNYTGAIEDFTKAIRLDTGFLQAYENRGVAKYYLNDHSGAVDDFTKALKINPNDFSTLGRRAWAEFHLQEYREAIADFSRSIDGNKRNLSSYFGKGQSEYYTQDYLGAISDFTVVIKIWSEDKEMKARAYYLRGMSKIDLQLKDNGCQDLRKAGEMGYPGASEAVEKYCR